MIMQVAQSCLTLLQLHGLYSPWNSPGQNTGGGRFSLLQGIFPTQGSNQGLPHCRWIHYQLSHKGSPSKSVQFFLSVKLPTSSQSYINSLSFSQLAISSLIFFFCWNISWLNPMKSWGLFFSSFSDLNKCHSFNYNLSASNFQLGPP